MSSRFAVPHGQHTRTRSLEEQARVDAKVAHLSQFNDAQLGMICTVLLLNISADAQEAQQRLLAENPDLEGRLAQGPPPPFRRMKLHPKRRWIELSDPEPFDNIHPRRRR